MAKTKRKKKRGTVSQRDFLRQISRTERNNAAGRSARGRLQAGG